MPHKGKLKMSTTLTFYPLGNADCTRIDLKNGLKLLIDYADTRNEEHPEYIDLPRVLKDDLRAANRDYFDVVLFTHLDKDHTIGAGEFFHFDCFVSRQGNGRIIIKELWVPAAAITEEGSSDDAQVIRQEARHRFINGKGIRVFSRPERLKDFCAKKDIRLEDRLHLITDAGRMVPDFNDRNAAAGIEIFIHNPMAWRLNDREVEERNDDSVVFQATFREGGIDTCVLFASDVDDTTLSQIVQSSKNHMNEDRLKWDIFKIPHHCSYKSLNSSEKGDNKTVPIEDVRWLCEDQASERGIVVSTSEKIPTKGSPRDSDPQPPHRQAANYYKEVAESIDGQFEVTMEHSSAKNPQPCKVTISDLGASFSVIPAVPAIIASSSPMRAGYGNEVF